MSKDLGSTDIPSLNFTYWLDKSNTSSPWTQISNSAHQICIDHFLVISLYHSVSGRMAMFQATLFSTLKVTITCSLGQCQGCWGGLKNCVPFIFWKDCRFSLAVENKGINNNEQNDTRSMPCKNVNDLFLGISLACCHFSEGRLRAFYSVMTCVRNFKWAVSFHFTRDWWVRYYLITPNEKIETCGLGMDKRF